MLPTETYPKEKLKDDFLELVSNPESEEEFEIDDEKIEFTDLGFAEYFVKKYRYKLSFCNQSKKWLVWDGKVWSESKKELHKLVKSCIKDFSILAKEKTGEEKTNLFAFHKTCQSRSRIDNMLSLANREDISFEESDFDNHPEILNLKNCMVDFSGNKFKIISHKPEMLIRQIIDLEYISNTECPKFLEFLNTIFGGNISMIDFIQECIGYSLSGFTTEDCLFFLYGTGKNGKSTFAEILKLLFGNYFHKANIELILQQKNNNIRNDIADLKGKRIVITSEIADGRHLAESLVKDFTGGDYITARRLYQDYFTFKPFFKLWVYGNHKPIIRGTDEGIKRRIKLIPFTVTIPSKEVRSRDSIIAEIIPELPGILNWALKGFNKWRENGSLCFPSEVSMATENYLKEMDRVQNFVNERCNVGVNYQMKVKDLYEGYQKHCDENGDTALSKRSFSDQLKQKGFENYPRTGNIHYWEKISLKS